MDPLVEQTMEPYSYVGNNPINFTDPTGMSAESVSGPPKIVVAVTNKVVKAVLSAIVKYDLYGAGGAIMYNGSKGASGNQSLIRQSNKNYSPDFWDVSGFIDAASTFGPGGPKVSRKPGSSTSQNAFRKFAAGVEDGKKVESAINAVEKHDEANAKIVKEIGVIVNYDISVSDGKTTSVEQNHTSVQFTGTAEQNKKSQDSLQEKNKQRASVKELYEKPN
ncbi:hypothetical protein [Flavobacterium sp. NKUCC04_CG]|uniref:hypothetical protein n=1 Tax=Flavobacterium sp. NKUCC04_CG TaxID=2842121 RepID=UPI00351D7E56